MKSFLSSEWKSKSEFLKERLETAKRNLEFVRHDIQRKNYNQEAKIQLNKNIKDNNIKLKQIAPMKNRIDKIELTIKAIKNGCEKTKICLLRWDIEAMINVAQIWERLQIDHKVSIADTIYYQNAGIVKTAEDIMMEKIQAMEFMKKHPGVVTDAMWEEVEEHQQEKSSSGKSPFLLSDQRIFDHDIEE